MNAEKQALDLDDGEGEQRLLDFVARLLLDLAHTHPSISDAQIALWLARVVLGGR